MFTLLPKEEIITESDAKQVILTTHRICYHQKSDGDLLNQHIMLEHVTSTEITKSSNRWLLIIAALACLFGVFHFLQGEEEQTPAFGAIIFALVVLIIYIVTRKKAIIIGSPSIKMVIGANEMSNESLFAFINKIDEAIANRRDRI